MSGIDSIPPNLIITNGAMASTNTLTSAVVAILSFSRIAFEAHWTGTPTGAFFVDVSASFNANTGAAGNWTPVPFSTAPVASGSTGTAVFEVLTAMPFIRCRYVNASGAGTLNVYLTGKTV